jgi:hypothetical protein
MLYAKCHIYLIFITFIVLVGFGGCSICHTSSLFLISLPVILNSHAVYLDNSVLTSYLRLGLPCGVYPFPSYYLGLFIAFFEEKVPFWR